MATTSARASWAPWATSPWALARTQQLRRAAQTTTGAATTPGPSPSSSSRTSTWSAGRCAIGPRTENIPSLLARLASVSSVFPGLLARLVCAPSVFPLSSCDWPALRVYSLSPHVIGPRDPT
eukprot:954829-Prorocentrum_minimum.AAC.1